MKKITYLIPIALFGLVLTGCSDPKALPKNYTDDDLIIDTEWVDYDIPATGLNFADGEESISLEVCDTHTYVYSVTPKAATNPHLNWVSLHEDVATVSDGVVTALKGGETKIVVSEEHNTFTPIELNVTVTKAITDFTVIGPSGDVSWNRDIPLEVTYEPSDTTYRTLNWSIPEEEQNIATISDGVLHTHEVDGTVHITVTSDELPGVSKEVTVRVQKVHVSSITLSKSVSTPIEVDKNLTLTATINPSTAEEASSLRYEITEGEDVILIDQDTGIVTGVKEGTAKVKAVCEGVYSNEVEIEVYEVHATGISIFGAGLTVTNEEGGSIQLEIGYTTDVSGHDKPSREIAQFSSSDPDIISVDNNGNLTAKGPGAATITAYVTNSKTEEEFAASTPVTSLYYAESLKISGPTSMYLDDDPITLTATSTPKEVSEDTVSWSVNPVTSATIDVSGKSVTFTPSALGPVTVTATMRGREGTLTATHTISVNERPIEFDESKSYIVGSASYKDGVAHDYGNGSWNEAKEAYMFTQTTSKPSSKFEYRAVINFRKGDTWKIKDGKDGWLDPDSPGNGWYKKEAALATNGGMMYELNEDGTDKLTGCIVVKEGGYYDIYYSRDLENHYEVYVCKHELTVGNPSVLLSPEGQEQIILNGGATFDTITYSEYDSSIISVSATGLITANAVGTTTVTVRDNHGFSATCEVEVKLHATRAIYLNANGKFDDGGITPFIHTWGEDGASADKDSQLVKATGQDCVYTVNIPEDHTKGVFVRMPGGSTEINWGNPEEGGYYNKSEDLDIPTTELPMFTQTGWGEKDTKDEYQRTFVVGEWSTYDPETHYEPEIIPVFENGIPYIVGNRNYSSGTSVDEGTEPWEHDVTKAYKVALDEGEHDADIYLQYKGTITFTEDDEFRPVIGIGEADDVYWTVTVQSTEGAFSKGQMKMSGNNIKVKVSGTYTFYVKCMTETAGGGWKLYIAGNGGVDPDPGTTKKIYLEPNIWSAGASEKYYGWLFGGTSEDKWYEFTVDGSYYSAEVASDYTKIIFLRSGPSMTPGWTKDVNYWNRTGDEIFGTNNCFKVTAWGPDGGYSTGTWSVH